MTDAAAPRSYRPGHWFGIFGDNATVALPPSEKERVAAIWSLVDDGAGFDEVLDALISGGLRDLPGFVLVSTSGSETKVVIRGEAHASFTTGADTVEVAGSGATTWAERTVADVTGLRLVVGDQDGPAPAYSIDSGLVRVSEVVSPAAVEPTDEPVETVAEPVETVAEPEEPVAEAPAAADAGPGWDDVSDTGPQTVTPDTEPPGPIGPEPGLPSTPPAPPVGVPSGPPPPVPSSTDSPTEFFAPVDHDGATGAVEPVEPEPSGPAAAVSRPVAKLVFSHGDRVEVDRAVLVGRAPEARRFTSGDQPRLVGVPSPAQEISSTHLEVRPGTGADHGSAVVTDLGSTNGTVLVQPGLPPEDLKPGIAVQLIPGAIIDLGDGVTIQVINP